MKDLLKMMPFFFLMLLLAKTAIIDTNVLNGPDNIVYYGQDNLVNGKSNQLAGYNNYIGGDANGVVGNSNVLLGQ